MKIWHISDTHSKHAQLTPQVCDVIVHSGDFSNSRQLDKSRSEIADFIEWFAALDAQHKVLVPGNHDMALFHKRYLADEIPSNIIYLDNEQVVIEGVKFYGSPFTPTHGGTWAWATARDKLHVYWDAIPEDTNVLITHGPPMGVLDKAWRYDAVSTTESTAMKYIEQTGCRNLMTRVMLIKPQAHLFGHLHNMRDIYNAGTAKISGIDTIFSNASCVEDGTLNVVNNGNIIYV